MIVSLTLLLVVTQKSGFSDLQICDPAHRTSWDIRGRKAKVYGFLPELESSLGSMVGAIAKGLGGREPVRKSTDPLERLIVLTMPWEFDATPVVRFKFGQAAATNASSVVLLEQGKKRWAAVEDLPTSQDLADIPISVGVANVRWRRAGSWNVKTGKTQGINFSPRFVRPMGINGQPVSRDKRAVVEATVSATVGKDDWRIVGFDRAGKEVSGAGSLKPLGKSFTIQQWMYGPQSAIARVELQTRPFVWTALGHVPVNPK